MTHAFFSGHDDSFGDVGGGSEARNDETDFLAGGLRASLSELSEDGCESFFSLALLPQSKAVPGVFGVLLALPKLENAPLPNAKAFEAPDPVGDATDVVVIAAGLLKGLLLLLSDGNRFDDEWSLESLLSVRSFLFVERLSLLVLLIACSISQRI